MTSLFLPSAQPQKDAVFCSPEHRATVCPTAKQDTSDIRAAEDQVDRHIRELGHKAERAIADGDPTGARLFTDRMYGSIASRTAAHRQRLENEAWARVTRKEWLEVLDEVGEHPGCFFDAAGAAIRRRMGRPT